MIKVRFQCREIGEGEMEDCSIERYSYCNDKPEWDTRILFDSTTHDTELLNRFAQFLNERCDLHVANMVRPFMEQDK